MNTDLEPYQGGTPEPYERLTHDEMVKVGQARCARCQEVKPLEDFNRHPTKTNGRASYCKLCVSSNSKTWYLTKGRERWLRKTYGIGLDEYNALVEKQEGRCAACGRLPEGRALDVDHDHTYGRVRGLLCMRCNLAIGHLGDDPDAIVALAMYLLRSYPIISEGELDGH
jgi:hypothetical protein